MNSVFATNLSNFSVLALQPGTLAAIGVFAFIATLVLFGMFARYLSLWIQSVFAGAAIGPITLVMMTIKKINPAVIVKSKIIAVQAGLTDYYPISTNALEAHYMAGGNVERVVRSLVAAHRAKIDLDWDTAAAIDLAGRDILEAVRTSVYPKVIDCPDPSQTAGTLDAVAGDGIQLKARGSRDRTDQHCPTDWWCHRRNRDCPRGARHCPSHRIDVQLCHRFGKPR